jgi:hypothetical protein
MALSNIDTSTVAAIIGQLGTEALQALEADFDVLTRRYPTLPWTDLVSALGIAGSGGVLGATAPVTGTLIGGKDINGNLQAPSVNNPRYASYLNDQVLETSDLGGVSNPAIFDTSSGNNAAFDSGVVDVSAWRYLFFAMFSPGPGVAVAPTIDIIADNGLVYDGVGPFFTAAVASQRLYVTWGLGAAAGVGIGAGPTIDAINAPVPRRIQVKTPAAGAGGITRNILIGRR